MQETIEQMSTQVGEKWNELPKNRKIQLGVGVGVLLLSIIVGVLIFTRPTMAILYNQNLDTAQIAEVVEVLDANSIPYTLINNGQNVEISEDLLNQAKIALATEDVPKGGYTFADAMNNTMSTTESEREAKLNQLTEANLENMLMAMDDIKYADVSLVIPEEKNSFIASQEESRASVLLTLYDQLSSKQMEGIARLVSSSVINLEIENINIMDTEGNILYMGGDAGEMSANDQQQLKAVAESDITNKVRQLLDPIYDEIRISSNLILDFDQYEELREEYIPQEDTGKGLPHIESSQTSSSTNTEAGGEPGTATNGGDIPTYQLGGGTTGESESSSTNIEYVNNKVVSNSIKNVGDIDYKSSTLAVHVFKEKIYRQELVEPTLDNAMSWEAFKEANKENIPIVVEQGIVESLQNGTGIENVVVYGYEKPIFIDEEVYEVDYRDFLPYVLILLIIIIVTILVARFRKHDDVVETEPELEIEEMLSVARTELELEEIELKESLETKRQIEKFVDEKPEAVANLLRNWLNEDEWE